MQALSRHAHNRMSLCHLRVRSPASCVRGKRFHSRTSSRQSGGLAFRLAPLAVGALAWNMNDQISHCQGSMSLIKVNEEDVTVKLPTPATTISGWQKMMAKLRRWLQLLYRWMFLSFNYSPALLTSPLLLIGTEGMKEFWWKLLIERIKQGGPCGIKFAQWLSTRPDLFPSCHRFEDLQSYSSGKLTWATVKSILIESFGENWSKEFSVDMDDEGDLVTVGEGCVAQVIRGQKSLGKGVKQPLAIKIIRPNVRENIDADADIMYIAAKTLEMFSSTLKCLSLSDGVEEFREAMLSHLDMSKEAHNLRQFRNTFFNSSVFGDSNVLGRNSTNAMVTFPEPLPGLVSKDVLVETMVSGPLLRDFVKQSSAAEKRILAKIGLDAVFQMAFIDNFVHGDLHPGNIIVLGCKDASDKLLGTDSSYEDEKDKSRKSVLDSFRDIGNKKKDTQPKSVDGLRLCIIDAGMVVPLKDEDQKSMVSFFRAVALNDGDNVAKFLVEKSRCPDQIKDVEVFKTEVSNVVRALHASGLRLSHHGIFTLAHEVLSLCGKHNVRLSAKYTRLLTAFGVAEGVLRDLDAEIVDINAVLDYVEML